MEFLLLDPTAQPATTSVALAPRPSDLRHKRLGLIDNTKANAAALLEAVAALLEDELQPVEVIRRRVPATLPADDALLDEIARECDLVIEAVGD
jgi:nucleotide-binding universal stress UspA family protein